VGILYEWAFREYGRNEILEGLGIMYRRTIGSDRCKSFPSTTICG
jgi:hypothetical protein